MIRVSRLLWPAALLILSACLPAAALAGSLPFNTLEQKNDAAYIGQQQYNALDPGIMVFLDQEAAEEGGVWFSETGRQELAHIPWQTQMVVAVFQGWKPSGGFGVTVQQVTRAENTLRVDAVFAAAGENPPPAVTSPYQVIALGRQSIAAGDLVVELWVAGERLAIFPEK